MIYDKKIAIDIDGVVCDLHRPLLDRVRRKYGLDDGPSYEDINRWDWEFKYSKEGSEYTVHWSAEIMEALNDDGFVENLPLIEEALSSIKLLDHVGFEIFFVTSRHPLRADATQNWIEKNFGPYDVVHSRHKSNGFRADVLIDDNPTFLTNYLEKRERYSKRGILMERPWNVDYTKKTKRVEIVKGWTEALEVLAKWFA